MWGSLLVQEKYQEEKACDKRHPYRIIIVIIIIIIIIAVFVPLFKYIFNLRLSQQLSCYLK